MGIELLVYKNSENFSVITLLLFYRYVTQKKVRKFNLVENIKKNKKFITKLKKTSNYFFDVY